MKVLSISFVAIALSLFADHWALAQLVFELPNPQFIDLGTIASDGSGGRQIQIRPLEPDEVGHSWTFFPPHLELPDFFPDPTPATPAQESIVLTEGTPLVMVIPQLAHFPFGAAVDVDHMVSGGEINVRASIHYYPYATATIYGPHEYLFSLGSLDAGQYHLSFDLLQTSEYSNQQTLMLGFMDFVVHPVPEPSSVVLFCHTALWPFRFGRCRTSTTES